MGEFLVNIHGQHDNQALLDPNRHLSILDEYGECGAAYEEYKKAFETVKAITFKLKSLTNDTEERNKRIETLRYETNM
ncbi:MAG: hypothetical protein IIU76_00225, partial [Bacteroidales bacterium]|nr:hypothetical protein [Bacteroidales bacterium]